MADVGGEGEVLRKTSDSIQTANNHNAQGQKEGDAAKQGGKRKGTPTIRRSQNVSEILVISR